MDYLSMLATKKPTSLHRLIETVPPPAYSVPRGGLPTWITIPLDRQIPYVRIPNGCVTFAKNRLGAKLYPQPKGSEFDAWPGSLPEYDPLHDPHLRLFFRGNQSLKLPAEPPCTLSQFNVHRRKQHHIRAKMIKMEMMRRDDIAREALLFKKVEEEKEKRRQRYLREEKAKESMRKVMEQREIERLEKERELEEAQKNLLLRIQRVQEMKEERKQEVARKARARQAVIKQRVDASKEIAMMKKVKNLKRMRKEDIKMKKSLQKAKDDRVKRRHDEDLRKWNCLWKSQEERMRLRDEALRAYTENMSHRVMQDLKEKSASQARRDEELRVIQLTNMKQPWADNQKAYARKLRHLVAQQWRDKLPKPKLRSDLKPYPERNLLRETAHSAVCGRSPSADTLSRATYWFDRWENVPRPVRGSLNAVIARTILNTTLTPVKSAIEQVYQRGLAIIKHGIATKPRPSRAGKRKSSATVEPVLPKKGSKKNIPLEEEVKLSPAEKALEQDKMDEADAQSLLFKSIIRMRSIMTEIIDSHVQRGLDTEAVTISTLPKVINEKSDIYGDVRKLAMFVSHTRDSDITIVSDPVKKAAERIARAALRVVKEKPADNQNKKPNPHNK